MFAIGEEMRSASAAIESMPGVRITGRYFNKDAFILGFQFSFGNIGLETQEHYNSNQEKCI